MRGRKEAAGSSVITFPGYSEVGEIATGTFATVYRAIELGTGRSVALKVLRVADTSPHIIEVFNKELGALALLSNHPNVTTLYRTFLTPEGRPVLVLELCRESLAQRVRQSGPLAPLEVVQVGVKIAGALETAHRSGLLHRDMKPQNILISQFDEPVLADFGVAALQVSAQATEGIFGFTTLHAPPEALEGHRLSPSADIYGLASSMYQLLVGRGPFAAYEGEAPASVILRILRDPAPRAPVNSTPIALADLMENALAKDPARRPQTAGAFAEALREIEALAGWPKTPYVVWGADTDAPPSADENFGTAKRGSAPSLVVRAQGRRSELPALTARTTGAAGAWLPRAPAGSEGPGTELETSAASAVEPGVGARLAALLQRAGQGAALVTPPAAIPSGPLASGPLAFGPLASGPLASGPLASAPLPVAPVEELPVLVGAVAVAASSPGTYSAAAASPPAVAPPVHPAPPPLARPRVNLPPPPPGPMSGPHAHPGTRAVVAPEADDRTVVAPEADEAESPPAVPDDASDDPFAMGPPWTDGRNRETEGAVQIPPWEWAQQLSGPYRPRATTDPVDAPAVTSAPATPRPPKGGSWLAPVPKAPAGPKVSSAVWNTGAPVSTAGKTRRVFAALGAGGRRARSHRHDSD